MSTPPVRTSLEGFPADIVVTDPAEGSVTITVDAVVYPLEAVYGAAYIFLDRCYVLLDRPRDGAYTVTLTAKDAGKDTAVDATALRAMLGEFANELLSQAWRQKIIESNRDLIEAVTTQMLVGVQGTPPSAETGPSLDELASFDFSDGAFDDPLGIAMSWEEKHRKKDAPADEAPPVTAPETVTGVEP